MDARQVVLEALAGVAGDKITPEQITGLEAGVDLDFEALDLDSLSRFEVMMQIEEALDLELDDDEVLSQGSILGLVAYLDAARGGA